MEPPKSLVPRHPSRPVTRLEANASAERRDAKRETSKCSTLEEALELVRGNGFMLACVPEELRSRDVCMTAVTQDGEALKFVPDRLKADRELVLAAIEQDATAFQHLPGSALFHDADIRARVGTAANHNVHAGRVALQYGIARSR